MKLRQLTLMALVAVTAFAAGAWAQATAGWAELDKVGQRQMDAMNATDWPAFEATLTEDSIKLEEGYPIIRGRAAVMNHFRGGPPFSQMKSATLETGVSGALAFAVYSGSHLDAKGVEHAWNGIQLFRREGGQWKVAIDASMNEKR